MDLANVVPSQAMKTYGTVDKQRHSFLNCALDEGEAVEDTTAKV
jgi:hypothetical protein